MSRLLSHTEISKALDCEAAWDFAYGGYLAGEALRPKAVAPTLSKGRAWGAGVAAWHQAHQGGTPLDGIALGDGFAAIHEALNQDAERMIEHGLYDREVRDEQEGLLRASLAHYVATCDGPLGLHRLEGRLEVPIRSRTGKRASTRYRFLSYVDGIHVDQWGRTWLVEFKFRGQLTPVYFIERSRQVRWYAWSYAVAQQRDLGEVAGVITDERINEPPKPARLVKARRKADPQDSEGMTPSHAKDQLCTPDAYESLCLEYGVQPEPETVEALRARRWQQRVPIEFLPGELEEAGRELVSAAQKIAELDSGRRYPLRNVKKSNCNGCSFKEICANPRDALVVDAYFTRKTPKRLLDANQEAA